MDTIGSFEAKTHLSSLLERVAKGEIIQITKRGVPIAKLVPVDRKQSQELATLAAEIRHNRREITLGGLKIRDLIGDGRRY